MIQYESPHSQSNDLSTAESLFAGTVSGLIAAVTTDERPMRGLLGLLDWRFEGQISKLLQKKFITGTVGECIYVPVTRAEKTYHLILLGVGSRKAPSQPLSLESLATFSQNLKTLGVRSLGISRKDFGELFQQLQSVLPAENQDGEVCILP